MANRQLDSVLQHIRKLVAAESTATLPDRELLDRFIQHRDEAAFASLVQRYGPMVLSVCRRVLGDVDDAEDACQATFLVFARKAASIRKKDSVGSWLHGVAYRAAANLKREVARRHAHEGRAAEIPQVAPPDITWPEVQSVLDEELQRLPKRFQAPLLLCYLEGKTRDEAARELGWSLGTVRGRLERGRELLRARLTRRGLTLSGALLASMLAEHAVAATLPVMLVVRIVKAAALVAAGQTAATGILSTKAAALMESGVKAMWMTKLKIASATWAALGFAVLGAGVLAKGMFPAQNPVAPSVASGEAARLEADNRKTGDEPPVAAGKWEQPSDPLQLARNQAESRRNLKKLALAMHKYHSTFNHFPEPAIYSNLGKAAKASAGGGSERESLLSWRVAILPYLGETEANLYHEFRLDQPWDSPHNKKLLTRMPKVYAPPGMTTREPHSTFYQVFVGPHAAFEKQRATSGGDFLLSGVFNGLLIVEAGCAVPWTKPEDLHFAVDEPIPELGGLFPGMFNAAFWSNEIWPFSRKMDSATLRKLIMRDGGPVDADQFRILVSRQEAELRQLNQRLKREVERTRARVEELQKEKEALQVLVEDPAAIDPDLKKDNADLEQLLRQAQEEAERLNQEIQRLKQALEKRPGERERK